MTHLARRYSLVIVMLVGSGAPGVLAADALEDSTLIWHARPGPGPIRHTSFIRNNTGQPVTIYHQDSLNVRIAGPGSDRVWYVNDDGSIPEEVGVYHEALPDGRD